MTRDKEGALKIWAEAEKNPARLYAKADRLRRKYFGNKVELCSVINAKSGNCLQDCRFCAQSVYYNTNISAYPLVSSDRMVDCARNAAKIKAHGFGIVTSGCEVDAEKELPVICRAVKKVREEGALNPDASLGRLTPDMASRLKEAGLVRYHHNLETAESFFPNICTTHSYKERVRTVKIAKEAGLEVCSGGLFGLGEMPRQRIELAFALKGLDVDSVPLNFLIPIAGTPLEGAKRLSADELLMTVAIFRVILQDKHIKVCGGREANLGRRQREIFSAGANGMMIGGYLTQAGNPPEEDLKMLKELGLEPA